MSTLVRLILPLGLALALSGCAMSIRSARLTPDELSAYGTHRFEAPRAKVHDAVVATLKGQNFTIALDNPQRGIVKTGRRLIRSAAQGGYGYAQAIDYTRQYVAAIRPAADGGTEVTLEPRVFAGEQDLSDGDVWVLEGDQGERTLWRKLFKEIGEAL